MPIAGPTRGCRGVVTIASTATGSGTAIGRLTNWSFNSAAEEIDASVMGACTKASVAGALKTTMQFDVQWDGDDSIQTTLTAAQAAGTAVWPRIYPEGTGSGANYYKPPSGGVIILQYSAEGGGVDGIVSATFNGTVNGAMTATSVP